MDSRVGPATPPRHTRWPVAALDELRLVDGKVVACSPISVGRGEHPVPAFRPRSWQHRRPREPPHGGVPRNACPPDGRAATLCIIEDASSLWPVDTPAKV